MLNVGLTGGIASGKTTIGKIFVENGAYLIDHDLLAHEAEKPGGLAWDNMVAAFGDCILNKDKTINRAALARIVFNNPDELKRLNAIVHPAVFSLWKKSIGEIERRDSRAIIISDVPLLFETGWDREVDLTVLVYVPPQIQVKRLMDRNNMSPEEATLRVASQMPIRDKIDRAGFVIRNDVAPDQARKAAEKIWRELVSKEQEKFRNQAT